MATLRGAERAAARRRELSDEVEGNLFAGVQQYAAEKAAADEAAASTTVVGLSAAHEAVAEAVAVDKGPLAGYLDAWDIDEEVAAGKDVAAAEQEPEPEPEPEPEQLLQGLAGKEEEDGCESETAAAAHRTIADSLVAAPPQPGTTAADLCAGRSRGSSAHNLAVERARMAARIQPEIEQILSEAPHLALRPSRAAATAGTRARAEAALARAAASGDDDALRRAMMEINALVAPVPELADAERRAARDAADVAARLVWANRCFAAATTAVRSGAWVVGERAASAALEACCTSSTECRALRGESRTNVSAISTWPETCIHRETCTRRLLPVPFAPLGRRAVGV
jgi:hypothetical protein